MLSRDVRWPAACRVAHAAAINVLQIGLHLLPVMQDALLAAGHFQQPGMQRFVPVPVAAQLGKGLVESSAVCRFGVGQGAVHVKNQGLELDPHA